MHRFEDAAFTQDFLLHNIKANGYFARQCEGFQESRFPDSMPPGTITSVMKYTLERSDPIYVSMDVMKLWQHASETFKPEPLHRTDLVVPSGFALFPEPFMLRDRHGKNVSFRAMCWLPISQRETYDWDEGMEGQGIWVSLLSNVNDIDDYWKEQHENTDKYDGATIRELSLAAGWDWSYMHGVPVMFEQPTAFTEEDGEEDTVANVNLWNGTMQCFWRLMSQLVITPEALPRQARRQRQRAQRIDTVKVLRLRRTRTRLEHEGEGAGIEYTHRWVVEGHWRNQPYGPKNARYYRQIWIAPYVKGPDDKPLVIKTRGVEFTR